jgi:hypothetical protein
MPSSSFLASWMQAKEGFNVLFPLLQHKALNNNYSSGLLWDIRLGKRSRKPEAGENWKYHVFSLS